MIDHEILGTNQVKNAFKFYDKVLEPLGMRGLSLNDYAETIAPVCQRSHMKFYFTNPFAGNIATVCNGFMLALEVEEKFQVDLSMQLHFKMVDLMENQPSDQAKMTHIMLIQEILMVTNCVPTAMNKTKNQR